MNLKPFLVKLQEICRENDIALLGVFGSVARGEDSSHSDVDLLIRLRQPIGLIRLIQLEDKFADILDRKVDLTTQTSLHPLVQSDVMRDLKILYEA